MDRESVTVGGSECVSECVSEAVSRGGRRRAQVNLQHITPAETIILEQRAASVNKTLLSASTVWLLSLLLLWVGWMLAGTVFYKCYANYTWSKAFYMNVNVGWGLNWVLEESFRAEEMFNKRGMQLFTLYHTVVGYIFILFFCIYVAMQLIVKKNLWLECAHQQQQSKYFLLQRFREVMPVRVREFDFGMWKFNIFFIIWIVVGIVWYSSTHQWRVLQSLDYVFSTATGAGYMHIQQSSADYEYAIFALYCVVACPLMTVSIGLVASTYFQPPHYRLMDRMFADICQEELDFMVDFGLIDTDGQISPEEFIILMAVRINRASPQLITSIYQRFQELDRQKMGKILMDDLLDSKLVPNRHSFSVNSNNHMVVDSIGTLQHGGRRLAPVVSTHFCFPTRNSESIAEEDSYFDRSITDESGGYRDRSDNSTTADVYIVNQGNAEASCVVDPTDKNLHDFGGAGKLNGVGSREEMEAVAEEFHFTLNNKFLPDGHNNKRNDESRMTENPNADHYKNNCEVYFDKIDTSNALSPNEVMLGSTRCNELDTNPDRDDNDEDYDSDDKEFQIQAEELTKRNLRKLAKAHEKDSEPANEFKLTPQLTIETDLDDDDCINNKKDKEERASPADDVVVSDSNSSAHRDHRGPVRGVLRKESRRSTAKKNVFSIMDTMQKEYIVHGDTGQNLYSPMVAARAMHPTKAIRNPNGSSSDSPLKRILNRRGSVEVGRSSGVGDSFFSFRQVRKGSKGSDDSPVKTVESHSQPAALRKSKSMELPDLAQSPKVEKRFSQPTAPSEIDAAMLRRRLSLEASSRSIQLTKFYQSNHSIDVDNRAPARKSSLSDDIIVEGEEFDPECLPALSSPSSLEKEKTLIRLSQMNKDFKRRKSSYLSAPSASMQLFRRVSSAGSNSSFYGNVIDGDDIPHTQTQLSHSPTKSTSVFGNSVEIDEAAINDMSTVSTVMNLPFLRIFGIWVLWIVIGAIFFTFYQDNDTSFSCGLFISISVGVGMFWMNGSTCDLENSPGTKAFTIVHMLLGSIALGVLRAFVAHTMAESKSLWYMHTNSGEDVKSLWTIVVYCCDGIKQIFTSLGPRVRIHATLTTLILFGVIFATLQFQYPFLEGLLFSFSALTCGGFIPVPDEGSDDDWQYAVIAVFITLGVPVMAVSLSLVANSVVELGSGLAAEGDFAHVMSILVTDKEIEMLGALDLEIEGGLDKREFTVLILLRVGAMTPDFVSVIVDWYRGIGEKTDDRSLLGEELIEFSSSESSAGSDAEEEEIRVPGRRRPSTSSKQGGKAKNRLTFYEMMSFSQVEAGDKLRHRANDCFSSMVID